MSKIKSVSQFEDNVWSASTPIGADASNIDVEMSDSSIKDLQTVLGDIPSTAASIQSQLNNKVTASGGNIQSTVVTTGIQNYDNSSLSDETSTALLDANVRVVNAQDTAASMWTKFNRFRRRVDNKFKDIFLSSVEDVASPNNYKTYSQSALNNYFSNVIGYTSAADVTNVGSVADQLETLNGYALYNVEIVTSVDEHIANWIVYHWKFKHPNTAITNDHFVLVQTVWSSPNFSGTLLNGWYYRQLGPFHWPYVFVGTPNGYFNLSYWGTGLYWGSMRTTNVQTFYLELFQNSSTSASGNGQIFAFGYI